MNTSNNNFSRKTVIIACGIFLLLYGGCYHFLIKPPPNKIVRYVPDTTVTIKPELKFTHYKGNKTSNTNNSGQRIRKRIKSIKVIPTTETYEVSQWVTAGDWSHDRDELTVTIPSQRIIMDIDYVEDHWDNFTDDPEDEILYPPDIFQ